VRHFHKVMSAPIIMLPSNCCSREILCKVSSIPIIPCLGGEHYWLTVAQQLFLLLTSFVYENLKCLVPIFMWSHRPRILERQFASRLTQSSDQRLLSCKFQLSRAKISLACIAFQYCSYTDFSAPYNFPILFIFKTDEASLKDLNLQGRWWCIATAGF
jgi:hypothetical protein